MSFTKANKNKTVLKRYYPASKTFRWNCNIKNSPLKSIDKYVRSCSVVTPPTVSTLPALPRLSLLSTLNWFIVSYENCVSRIPDIVLRNYVCGTQQFRLLAFDLSLSIPPLPLDFVYSRIKKGFSLSLFYLERGKGYGCCVYPARCLIKYMKI